MRWWASVASAGKTPNIVAQLSEWGADMNKYPKSRVGKMIMVPETFAAQLDEKLELNFSEVLIKRAGFLIGAYWTGEKTKESTLTFFSRASTIGGHGLTPEQAQTLIVEIDSSRDLVDLLPGTPGERPPAIENSGEVAVKEIEKEVAIGEVEVVAVGSWQRGEEKAIELRRRTKSPRSLIVNAPRNPPSQGGRGWLEWTNLKSKKRTRGSSDLDDRRSRRRNRCGGCKGGC